MRLFVKGFLLILIIALLVVDLLFVIWGLYEQLFGAARAMNLLEKLHIPLNYNQVLLIGIVCLAILCFLNVLRRKI